MGFFHLVFYNKSKGECHNKHLIAKRSVHSGQMRTYETAAFIRLKESDGDYPQQ